MASDTSPPSAANGASPLQRAEALVDRLGDRLSEARQSATQAVATADAGPDGVTAPERPATERAEEILTRSGERLGRWLAAASRQVRRAAALAREEAEDIWVEAQAMHRGEATSAPLLPPLETPTDGPPI